MTDIDYAAFFADLEREIAALPAEPSESIRALEEELAKIGCPEQDKKSHPDIVGDASAPGDGKSLAPDEGADLDGSSDQCASPSYPISTSNTSDEDHESQTGRDGEETARDASSAQSDTRGRAIPITSMRKAARRSSSTTPVGRKPRRAAARLDEVAASKTWSGSKHKARSDRLTNAEKFSAAVWQVAAAGGVAVSLNLGIRRESMLSTNADPKRRMMQTLSRHLSEAGFGKIPYAFVFEISPADNDSDGRLHLHGVIDTSGLGAADLEAVERALRKAASETSGPIGGQRQLLLKPLQDPAGWADYLLKDVRRTTRELGIDDPFMINNPMRKSARDHFEHLRRGARERRRGDASSCREFKAMHCNEKGKITSAFTFRLDSAMLTSSGERDDRLVGGVPGRARHRPSAKSRSVSTSQPRGLSGSVTGALSSYGRSPVQFSSASTITPSTVPVRAALSG